MNDILQFENAQYRHSLDRWMAECSQRMAKRFPLVDFNADNWAVQSLYQTEQRDWNFKATAADFTGKDRNYCDAVRCLVAEMMISGKPKDLLKPISAFRLLATTSVTSLFDLTIRDLRTLEKTSLTYCKKHPSAADRYQTHFGLLTKQIILLTKKNALPYLGYRVSAAVQKKLQSLRAHHKTKTKTIKETLLDLKIEALNDAINLMVDGDSRLDSMDYVAICAMIRKLCAPSRINEVLCSSIDDHVTVDDYAQKPKEALNK